MKFPLCPKCKECDDWIEIDRQYEPEDVGQNLPSKIIIFVECSYCGGHFVAVFNRTSFEEGEG